MSSGPQSSGSSLALLPSQSAGTGGIHIAWAWSDADVVVDRPLIYPNRKDEVGIFPAHAARVALLGVAHEQLEERETCEVLALNAIRTERLSVVVVAEFV